MRSLIIGGNRSGKSARGEEIIAAAAGSAEVVYVAPGLTSASDPDFAARVAAHQARRPAHWRTIESRDLPSVLRQHADGFVLVDDVPAWLTATIDASLGWTGDRAVADPEIAELLAAIAEFRGELVLVTAEVGLGVLAATSTGRQFADILGSLNTQLAAACGRCEFVVAGRALPMGGAANGSAATVTTRARDSSPMPSPATTNPSESGVASAPAAVGAAAPSISAAPDPGAGGAAAAVDVNKQGTDGEPHEEFPGLADAAHYDDPAVFPRVQSPDRDVYAAAYDRQAQLTKPAGSLGRLEELSIWYASCRGAVPPPPVADVRVVVFAGDHGIAEHGVSAYPQEVTVQMVANIVAGGAAVSVLAQQVGAQVTVVDMAVAGDTPEQVRAHKVRRSSGALDREDALTPEQTVAAIAAGRRLADEAVDSGADLLIAGDLGIGNTTPATVLTAVICGLEPATVVGRGTGVDDNGWMRKATAVRDAMFRSRDLSRKPVALLQRAGGADLAAMAGFLAQAAVRQTPCLLDGAVVTAAALVADELAPGARNWWQAGHRSVEPGHTEALKHLGLNPLLEAEMRLGEGSGAVAALPILQSSVAVLRDMATFADAGVSEKSAAPEPGR